MTLLTKLIEQSGNPKGIVGSIMISIMNVAHAGMRNQALKKIHIRIDDTILDIGCGGGQTLHTLSRLNEQVKLYGIDYSKKSVEDSIRKNKHDVMTGKLSIREASVSSIPFPDDFFNIITAFQTHYFWPDLKNDVKEVYRVLQPNGCFMIVSELYKINYHMKEYRNREELKRLFVEIGFKEVQFHENNNKKWICIIGKK